MFAVAVDCPELNVTTPAESVSPRQANEIIIAVPPVSSANERKSAASKRAAIISFEEDENATLINNNELKSLTPPTAVSLADACLKYQEKQKLAEEKLKAFKSDSTYERLHAEPINVASSSHPNETVYIEPESPTAITIINPVTQPYSSLLNSFDYKETDSSIMKVTDSSSSSVTSNTTTHSSNSPTDQIASQHSTSMSSSISSDHNSPAELNRTSSPENNEYASRIQELTNVETEHVHRIQELEKRCASLEERVTALTL